MGFVGFIVLVIIFLIIKAVIASSKSSKTDIQQIILPSDRPDDEMDTVGQWDSNWKKAPATVVTDIALKEAGELLGFEYIAAGDTSDTSTIVGNLNGVSVQVNSIPTSADGFMLQATQYVVVHWSVPLIGFKVDKKVPSAPLDQYREDPIQTIDTEFNSLFNLYGQLSAEMQAFMNQKTVDVIKKALLPFDEGQIDSTTISVTNLRREKDAQTIFSNVIQLVSHANVLFNNNPIVESESVEQTIEPPLELPPEQTVPLLDDAFTPEMVDESPPENETNDVEYIEDPGDPEPTEKELPEEPAAEENVDENSATAFCSRLFIDGEMSTAIEEKFEEYKGQTVEWVGTLERFSEFRFDFVFGEKPGMLATFEIHRIPTAFGSGTPVKAIVHLDAEAEAALKENKDQKMSFKGTLLSISAFSKQVFVTDGMLGTGEHIDNDTEH